MIHLQALRLNAIPEDDNASSYPFTVPAVKTLDRMTFDTPVTFFVGENGSGKSTILEAIAAGAELPTVGLDDIRYDETLSSARRLASAFRFSWTSRTRRGFFLRSEDFFGFVRYIAQLRSEMRDRLDEVNVEYAERSSLARKLAEGPARASLYELERRYGADFDANSHGERFLKLIQRRVWQDGLYLIDEPEAALSPQSQITFVAMLTQMIKQDSQFIIATHSPIILSTPGAKIYSFDSTPPKNVTYDDLEHVTLTRDFLNHPERYLRHFMDEGSS